MYRLNKSCVGAGKLYPWQPWTRSGNPLGLFILAFVALLLVEHPACATAGDGPIVGAGWTARQINPQARTVPAAPKPKKSRHGVKKKQRRVYRPHWGIVPGRPAVVSAPFSTFPGSWPAGWGHAGRPVVTALGVINEIHDPQFTPYVPGRPFASPSPTMSLLTPHYVVRVPPEYGWIGGGRLRTAQRNTESSRNRK